MIAPVYAVTGVPEDVPDTRCGLGPRFGKLGDLDITALVSDGPILRVAAK